ncbi:hypothetical protein HF521_002805 [Silurus meridionalis]|uniref:Secreted protein n=1 Tax=Silurus meridionalis TaxID=175797 RepID=A0A8T0B107_SILME|nr:hypothetical protein HF521_002805 [Silurus meridionalis]
MPLNFSPALALLLTELLCRTPVRQMHCLVLCESEVFNGISFDSRVLMMFPIQAVTELRDHPNRPEKSMRESTYKQLQSFECELFDPCFSLTELSPAIPEQE